MYEGILRGVKVALLVQVDDEQATARKEELETLLQECMSAGVGLIYLLPNTGFAEPLKEYESAVTIIDYGDEPSYSADMTQILSCKSILVQNRIGKIAIFGAQDKLRTIEKLMNGPVCPETKDTHYGGDEGYQGGDRDYEDDSDSQPLGDDLQRLEWIAGAFFGANKKIDTVVLDKQPLSLRPD